MRNKSCGRERERKKRELEGFEKEQFLFDDHCDFPFELLFRGCFSLHFDGSWKWHILPSQNIPWRFYLETFQINLEIDEEIYLKSYLKNNNRNNKNSGSNHYNNSNKHNISQHDKCLNIKIIFTLLASKSLIFLTCFLLKNQKFIKKWKLIIVFESIHLNWFWQSVVRPHRTSS